MTIQDAVIRSGELVPVPPVTADQLELIRKTIAKEATPDELLLYSPRLPAARRPPVR